MGILVVAPIGELAGEDLNTFVNTKRTCLGYAEASIQVPLGPGHRTFDAAHLGAVKSVDDARKFLTALGESMPRHEFRPRTMQYENADRIVWHYPQA